MSIIRQIDPNTNQYMSSSTPANHDLTTESGVKTYLVDTPFASYKITSLSVSSANYTYRLHLSIPYEGRSTLVLKHAQPHVKLEGSIIRFGIERQKFEVEAMNRVKAWLPSNSTVTVLEVHVFDEENHVMIIEDCGEDTLTLKELVRQGKVSLDLASAVGTSIGQFLGSLHSWGRKSPGDILGMFKGNQEAIKMSAWATYGRLVSTVNGVDRLAALSDPPINISERDSEVIAKVASDMGIAMNTGREFFVMGDFWTGNIMVALGGGQRVEHIYILDWELAKTGLPGADIGQFCAEIHLLRRFEAVAKDAASRILSTFLEAYSRAGTPDFPVCRDAMVHWGVHLAVWTPRIPWGDKATTRNVVEEGVQFLVGASSADEDWLRASNIGALLPKH